MPDKIITQEPAAARILRELAEAGKYKYEYPASMEPGMQRHGMLPVPHMEEARYTDSVMKASMMPPRPPKPDNIRIKKDFITESITVKGVTARAAMPELRRKIAAAFGDNIKYCEQAKADHEKKTGRLVKDVNLDLNSIIRDLTVLSEGNETDEEIDDMVSWAVFGAMQDFRDLSTPAINNRNNKTISQTNVIAPMEAQGVTPTFDSHATEQYSDTPRTPMALPVNTPTDDNTSTPEAIIQAYLHQAYDNEPPAYQRNAPASSMGTNPLLALTPEERQLHEQAREQLMADEGYQPDGSKTFLKKLSENKDFINFQNHIVLPAITLATIIDGAGEVKELLADGFANGAIDKGIVAKTTNNNVKEPSIFDLPSSERGFAAEKMRGGNLAPGFKTIDKFDWDNGIATSIKSIDLTLPSYQNPSVLKSRLKKYVDTLLKFKGAKRGGENITANMMKEKVLDLVIQEGKASDIQLDAIDAIADYAWENGIDIIISVVK